MGCLLSFLRSRSNLRAFSFGRGAIVVEDRSAYWSIVPNHAPDVMDTILKSIGLIIAPHRTFENVYRNYQSVTWINYWTSGNISNDENMHNIRVTNDIRQSNCPVFKVHNKSLKIFHFTNCMAILSTFKILYVNIYGIGSDVLDQQHIIKHWCSNFDIIFYKIEESGRREMVNPTRLYELNKNFGRSTKAIFLFDRLSEPKEQFLKEMNTIVMANGDQANFVVLNNGKNFYLRPSDGLENETKSISEIINRTRSTL